MGVSRERALVHVPAPGPSPEVSAAEARVAALLAEVDALDRAVESHKRDLSLFERRYSDATAGVFAELDRAQRLARRLAQLVDAASTLTEEARRGPQPSPRRRARRPGGLPLEPASPSSERSARATPDGEAGPGSRRAEMVAPTDLGLKALYRRLARRLHPDLARGDDRDRARLSDLMARASDAYARGDRVALELLAERLGAGDLPGSPSEGERLAHLRRRERALEEARERLRVERAGLLATGTSRLHRQAVQRAAEGADFIAEARVAAESAGADARAAALRSLERLLDAARELGPARRCARDRSGRRRDLVAASPFVRRALVPGDFRGAGPAARVLARHLEEEAGKEVPWQAALTLLAFACEAAGRAPDAVATRAGLEERWGALSAGWRGAPDLARALEALPREVAIGLRLRGEEVEAGLQLASPDLAPALRLALRREQVRELASHVLAALGPREHCVSCGADVYAIHVLRIAGLDELHGLSCPGCAAVLRSYLRYGEPQGIEALRPMALALGLVVELQLRFAGARFALGMLPAERARLTARALARRFTELVLAPHGLELPRGALLVRVGRAALPPGARVPEVVAVRIGAAPGSGIDEADLLDRLRSSLARRFKT